MDCNRYETLLLDDLYDEMDDITRAAVKKHLSTCAACSMLRERTLSTRKAFALPSLLPSADLEAKIFAATDNAIREQKKVVPIRPANRLILAAGRWASRPQTAMAAVFMLMIGSGALLVRGKQETGADVVVSVSGKPDEASDPALPPGLVAAAPAARGDLQGSSPSAEERARDSFASRSLGGTAASAVPGRAYAEAPGEVAQNYDNTPSSTARSYASPKVAAVPRKVDLAPGAPAPAAKPMSTAAAKDALSEALGTKGGAGDDKDPWAKESIAKDQPELKKKTETKALGCPASLPGLRSAVSTAPVSAQVVNAA